MKEIKNKIAIKEGMMQILLADLVEMEIECGILDINNAQQISAMKHRMFSHSSETKEDDESELLFQIRKKAEKITYESISRGVDKVIAEYKAEEDFPEPPDDTPKSDHEDDDNMFRLEM